MLTRRLHAVNDMFKPLNFLSITTGLINPELPFIIRTHCLIWQLEIDIVFTHELRALIRQASCHPDLQAADGANPVKRAALYCRVSTTRQNCQNQLGELRASARRNGWDVVLECIDEGVSGAQKTRPALDRLLRAATQRQFDVLMCWDISRLGRSLSNLVHLVEELRACNVDLFFYQQAIDTTTPSGKLSFQIFASLAEWERELLRERVRAGLDVARQKGIKLGRPSRLNTQTQLTVGQMRLKGMSLRQIASSLGIGLGTVHKALSPQQA